MWGAPARCRLYLVGIVALVIMTCQGCGDGRLKTVPVKATVTLDGQPIGPATIMFLPKGQEKQAAGMVDAQGVVSSVSSYGDNDGLTLGEFRVVLTPPMGTASKMPGIYADETSSPLTVKVDSSTTDLKIDMLSSAGPPAKPAGGIKGSMSSEEMMKQFAPKTE